MMEAPPANAQKPATPFRDVVESPPRLRAPKASLRPMPKRQAASAWGCSLPSDGNQNVRNARSNTYIGSLQTGPSEDQNGQRKWAAVKGTIAAADPALNDRDDKEEARSRGTDHRFNHWTNVRDGLMNAHASCFPRCPRS